MSGNRFLIVFAVASITAILAYILELTWLYYLAKPMVMLIASFYFFSSTKSEPNTPGRNLMLAGFLTSAAGDTLLMFAEIDDLFFIFGLVAFLLVHICYSTAFIRWIFTERQWNHHWGQLAFSTLVVVFGAEFYILNRMHFGELKYPVMIYCIAITVMGVAAVMRDRSRNTAAYNHVVAGAVLFILSDALLATDKFIMPFKGAGLAILGSYFAAQYLILAGVLPVFRKTLTTKKIKTVH